MLDAALRLLPSAQTVELWDNIAERIPEEADWNWTRNVCSRLLGETLSADAPVRPAVYAADISSLLHMQPDFDAEEAWRELLRIAPNHPDEKARAQLQQRATAGIIAARAKKGVWPDEEQLQALKSGMQNLLTGLLTQIAPATRCILLRSRRCAGRAAGRHRNRRGRDRAGRNGRTLRRGASRGTFRFRQLASQPSLGAGQEMARSGYALRLSHRCFGS